MSRALAVAFVVVLVFVAAAGLLVYLNLGNKSPQTPPVAPSVASPAPGQTGTPTPPETLVAATPTPALWASPTPTDRAAPSAPATDTPPADATLTATPTAPATATAPPASATPTASPAQSATPAGAYSFYLDGPVVHDTQISCLTEYLRGMVRDRAGNPLEGVRILASDLWGNIATTTSKSGPDSGKWDIVLGNTPNIWRLMVVDAAGNPLSAAIEIPHHQEGEFKHACTHLANWRRAW